MKTNVSMLLVVLCLSVSCTATHKDKDKDTENENVSSTTSINSEGESIVNTEVHTNIVDEKINFIKSFYTEYITENCTDDGLPNIEDVEKIKEKYCSKELLTKIKMLDYDPFLNVQDCDLEWLKILNIKADTKEDSWFIVSYSYIDYLNIKQNIRIRLKIILIDKSYCIVDIEGI
ncbi:MAG: hypothetical protein GX638_09205 [Crenarchaeota archaeon]|jgi:hypothetical protein|nr:hypothetical protein [Thermoproteota archaeon]